MGLRLRRGGLRVLDFERTLRAAQQGDGDAFARLWRQFQPGLLRYLSVKAAPVSDDLAAEVWARVLGALPSFEGGEQNFKAWLFTTARNRLTDWYRSNQRRLETTDDAVFAGIAGRDQVEVEVMERSATDAAIALIRRLPPAQAEAVTLRVVAGLDVERCARVMDRSPGSVRVLCHRGLRMLERMLAEDPPAAGRTTAYVGMATTDRPPTLESA